MRTPAGDKQAGTATVPCAPNLGMAAGGDVGRLPARGHPEAALTSRVGPGRVRLRPESGPGRRREGRSRGAGRAGKAGALPQARVRCRANGRVSIRGRSEAWRRRAPDDRIPLHRRGAALRPPRCRLQGLCGADARADAQALQHLGVRRRRSAASFGVLEATRAARAATDRPGIDATSIADRPHHGSTADRHPESAPERPDIDPSSSHDRPQIRPDIHPTIDPGSTPS